VQGTTLAYNNLPSNTDAQPYQPNVAVRRVRTTVQVGAANTPNPPVPQQPAFDLVQQKPVDAPKVHIVSYGVAFPVDAHLVVTSAAVVRDALNIDLQGTDGIAMKAEVVRSDEASGLVLLRVSGTELRFLEIGSAFPGGAAQCAAFPNVNVFDPTGELIGGSGAAPQGAWKVRLDQHPRLPGGPLISSGKVVGVELAARDSDLASIPAATAEQLRAFLGTDLPATPSVHPSPVGVLLQVLATRESR
jgi:hypothetical protein